MRLSTSTVFLTGTTGLIGGEIARSLLEVPAQRLWAMARPDPNDTLAGRLAHRLGANGHGLEPWSRCLRPVSGDLTQPGLGLAPADAAEIGGEADCLIHCAGETSFVRGQACRRTNVQGMQHLLAFARGCQRLQLLVYISTATNCGKVSSCCLPESEASPAGMEHFNEYTRSKAEAEQLLRASGLPVLIVRPSIVLSAGLLDKRFAMNILWCLPVLNLLEAAPVDPASRLDIVTVRFVVESLLRLLQLSERRHTCYHLSAGQLGAVAFGRIAEFLDEFYNRGEPLKLIPPQEWAASRRPWPPRTRPHREAAAKLRPYLPFLNMNTVFENRRLAAELGPAMPDNPELLSYLGTLLRQFSLEDALLAARNP